MRKPDFLPVAVSFLTLAAIVLSLVCGSTSVDLSAIFDKSTPDGIIFFSIRVPRTAACLLAGLAFSLSGYLLQSATGNDLASPNIIGVNAGAGAAVLLFLCLAPELFWLLPAAAFLGAMSAVGLVSGITVLTRRLDSSSSLILAGVAVNALFNAIISTLGSLFPDSLSSYSSFSAGGFSNIDSASLYVPAAIIITCIAVTLMLSRTMTIIRLDDEIASSCGMNPVAVRTMLSVLAALSASAAVTFSGLLGFVGLVTPHLASFLWPKEGKAKIVITLLCGSSLVLLADVLSRVAIRPAELPAGVFLAVIGVPFFIFLLLRRKS